MFTCICKRFYGFAPANKERIKDILSGKSGFPYHALVQGWVRSIRKHKRAVFLDINDGSSLKCLQVVVDPEKFKSGISYGASIQATGNIVNTKLHKDGIEFACHEIDVLGLCDESYPFMKHSDHDMQYQRPLPHLRAKETAMASVLRTRNVLEMEIHKYFQKQGFLHVHTPLLTSSDCEGAGALFQVDTETGEESDEEDDEKEPGTRNQFDSNANNAVNHNDPASHDCGFFGTPVFLSVSGQLHLEACALGVGDVYTLSPAFRAERGITRKHLSEFRMLEVEVAFTQCLEDIMDLMEDNLKLILRETYEKCWLEQNHSFKDLTEQHKNAVEASAVKKYRRLTYTEAVEILQRNRKQFATPPPSWGDNINNEQENFLLKHCDNLPVFITDFPSVSKPFYAFANPDGKTTSSVDLLFPYCGELCGGTVREHRLDILQEKLDNLGMREKYDWYLDLRRYGNVPHSGYGMGFDRLVRFILGISNIRDAVPFPRAPKSCLL